MRSFACGSDDVSALSFHFYDCIYRSQRDKQCHIVPQQGGRGGLSAHRPTHSSEIFTAILSHLMQLCGYSYTGQQLKTT